MAVKIISLNIEGHRHLERVIPFLQEQQADIINLQEVFAVDMPVLEQALQKKSQFIPLSNVVFPNKHVPHTLGEFGIAQLFGPEVDSTQCRYYAGPAGKPVPADHKLPIFFEDEEPNSIMRAVSWVRGTYGGSTYTVATTHFTWSPQGKATELQRKNLASLFQVLDQIPEFVLTGDFNAPRGGELFAQLAEKYQDNIPPDITTSLDPDLHKAGKLELMVDGFFSQPSYTVKEVQVIGGVSDHKAVVGMVEKGQTAAQ